MCACVRGYRRVPQLIRAAPTSESSRECCQLRISAWHPRSPPRCRGRPKLVSRALPRSPPGERDRPTRRDRPKRRDRPTTLPRPTLPRPSPRLSRRPPSSGGSPARSQTPTPSRRFSCAARSYSCGGQSTRVQFYLYLRPVSAPDRPRRILIVTNVATQCSERL